MAFASPHCLTAAGTAQEDSGWGSGGDSDGGDDDDGGGGLFGDVFDFFREE